LHPLEDPRDPLKTQYNPLKNLLGPPDFGLRDLWLTGSYHPRRALAAQRYPIGDAGCACAQGGGTLCCFGEPPPGARAKHGYVSASRFGSS
jgi:hypothetical protein